MGTIVEKGIDLVKTDHRRKKQAHNNHDSSLVDHAVLDDLPENLVFDILVRLPIETLCSSRFVCKSWFEIISSHDFRNAHLHRSDTTTRGLIFLAPVEINSSPPKEVFYVESNSMLVDTKFSKQVKFVEIKDGKKILKEYKTAFNGKIVTRELEDIPLRSKPSSLQESYGLAFCHVSRRYKLLHLFKNTIRKLLCEIMDIGSGSWRAVGVPPAERIFDYSDPVFAMGALHWIQCVVDGECMVISMSLDDEKYKTMAIPKTGGQYIYSKSVFAMGEFLGFAERLQRADNHHHQIVVWILRGLGGECGWEKQYNIDIGSGYKFQMTTTLLKYCGGEFVFKLGDCLCAYDRHSRRIRTIEKSIFFRCGFPHLNSLVSWRS